MSDRPLGPEALLAVIRQRRSETSRLIVALAGPPGSGKSTLAGRLAARLNDDDAGSCAVVPMDGFHLDDMLLEPLGWRMRKGAPHTFDAGGLAVALRRLRRNDEAAVAVPVFDRRIEIARAGARLIPQTARVVIVEGNYLLLAAEPWSALHGLFDVKAMVLVSPHTLRARLESRWRGFGLGPDAIAKRLEGNDLPNARLVTAGSVRPDLRIDGATAEVPLPS